MNKFNKVFFLFIILIGLIFVFLVPPFQKADESYHYFNTYSVSVRGECGFFGVGLNNLPVDILNFPEQMKASTLIMNSQNKFPKSILFREYEINSKEKAVYNGSCVKFGILSYLPNIIGITIGGNNLLLSFYLSRLFGFIIFLVAVFISLNLSGRYFPLIMAISIIPMVIHQVTAISYDSFHISLGLLSFSLYVYLKNNFSKIKLWLLFLFYALILIFVLVKSGYYLLLLLPILLPSYPFFNKNIKNIFIKYLILIIYFLLTFFLIKTNVSFVDNVQSGLVNPFLQKEIVLDDPFYFISVLSKTTAENLYFYWNSFLGNFGWLDYQLPFSVYLLIIFFVIFIVSKIKFVKTKKLELKNIFELLFIFGIVIGSYVIIETSLYLTWTPVANKIIGGVQGRYFFILFLFFMYGIVRLIEIIGMKKMELIFSVIFVFVVSVSVIKSVYLRYYDYSSVYKNINELTLDGYKDYKNKNSGYELISITDNKFCENIGDDKIGGFVIYLTNNRKENIYIKDIFKYEIISGNKILHSGYLNQEKIQIEGRYLEEFKKILKSQNNGEICVRLYKKYSLRGSNSVLYFVEKENVNVRFLKISK